MNLFFKQFKHINLADVFFDSLKADYAEFSQWFAKKSEDSAYVFQDDLGNIDGFLYVKIEDGAVMDTVPPLPPQRRLKVGTLKINAHGTKLGERFVKKIFDHAISSGVNEIYVTVFAKHAPLIGLLSRYGFLLRASKTTPNGVENVYVKTVRMIHQDLVQTYPMVVARGQKIYMLALKPEWHTRLLPDSILQNESDTIVQDVSHTNSIHKVYLTKMRGVEHVRRGDVILIYRTSDQPGRAYYRSVATSICVIEENRNIYSFANEIEFLDYCRPYSVFTETELRSFWARKQYPHILKFTYNMALPKRVNRQQMIDDFGLDADAYAGFVHLSPQQFSGIVSHGGIDESLIVY